MEQALRKKMFLCIDSNSESWISESGTEYLEGFVNKKFYSLCYNPDMDFYIFLENHQLVCALAQPKEISEALEYIQKGKPYPPSIKTRELSFDIGIKLTYP